MPTDVYIPLSYVLRISHDLYYYPFVEKSYVVKLFVILDCSIQPADRRGTGRPNPSSETIFFPGSADHEQDHTLRG